MGKYFGTDGVRGEANVELTPELAFKLGRFGGYVLSQHEEETPLVFVGRDTRISGEMLEHALIAGLLSVGIRVYKLGVIATPGVAYLVRTEKQRRRYDSASTIQPWTMASNSCGDGSNWMMIANLKLKPCLMLLKIPFHVQVPKV